MLEKKIHFEGGIYITKGQRKGASLHEVLTARFNKTGTSRNRILYLYRLWSKYVVFTKEQGLHILKTSSGYSISLVGSMVHLEITEIIQILSVGFAYFVSEESSSRR